MTQIFNKLVRDKIPDIIIANGEVPVTRVLSTEEHQLMLNNKLLEEVKEYLESGEPEELADILEVVRGISNVKGLGFEAILKIMEEKHAKRGGFDDKVFLIETTE